MFRVENADFIADKLAAELLPNQEFREVVKNSIEAVGRRMAADGITTGGRIELDVDWHLHDKTGNWYICCADNGDGMGRSELDRYTTTLAVQGAGRNQSLFGNQGMGLKISGPTRHKRGLLIRSLKSGERTAVQIGWNGSEYGLIPIGHDNELVTAPSAAAFPDFVNHQGSGTVVTFFGNSDGDNTFAPPDRSRGWLFKYLNMRFFRLSNDAVEVLVRVASGDPEEWPHSLEEAGKRKSFNLQRVYGTAAVWDDAADKQGAAWRGTVHLAGNPSASIAPADIHWWVLPVGPGSDVSSRTASGGSFAILFQNELHDWRTGNQANPFFARLGVLFAKSRIAFILEPKGTTIASDFARAHVLVGGIPIPESEAWLLWSEQFRSDVPQRIRDAMAEEQARLQLEDPDRLKRIRDRLKEVMQLLRPRRFRRKEQGPTRAAGSEVTGPGAGAGNVIERPTGQSQRPLSGTGGARGIGAVLSEFDEANGVPAAEVFARTALRPQWVAEDEAEGMPIVNGNGNGIRDRAAALNGTDGRSAELLLLNRDFRGYQALLAATNEWANAEGDEDKASKIEAIVQEWIEQKMLEAVQGLRQLENGKTWITEHYDAALSPVSLTAAFMADRYHTLREVKRAVGSLRTGATAVA